MRKSKISADITKEASDMLVAYCKKHERSKGFLLEKMIRKFCADIEPSKPKQEVVITKPEKPKVKRFVPPTYEQVSQYCNERLNHVDAQEFVDHYSSNGWMRGKAKIKDWKACVRTWEKNAKPIQQNAKQYSDVTAQNIKNLEGGW